MWSNAFHRWMLKMDQCLYKFLYPMKLPVVPLLMKRITAVRLLHLDMLQFREQMNHLWRNMHTQQVSTRLRGPKCPTNDPLEIRHPGRVLPFFSIYSVHPLTQLTHSRFFLVTVMQCRMHPSRLNIHIFKYTWNRWKALRMGIIHRRKDFFIGKLLSNACKCWFINLKRLRTSFQR